MSASSLLLLRCLIPALSLLLPQAQAFPQGSSFACSRSMDGQVLDQCVKEGLSKLILRFKSGDMALGVPPLDPMGIPFLQIRKDEPNLSLDITMKNVNIEGFSGIKLAKVTTNLDDVNKVEVSGKTAALHISGDYTSEGLVVNFPLHSSGTFLINMTEVTSSWVVYLREVTRDQVKFLQVDEFDVDMMPINIHFQPAAQLDDDNNLGEAVNIILNENSHEIYSLVKGRIASVFSGVLTELANQVLRQVPESVYLQS